MTIPSRFAVLLDGAFVLKKIQEACRRFPEVGDLTRLCERIRQHSLLKDHELLRIYFYHARPAEGTLRNPMDNKPLDLATTDVHRRHSALIDKIELLPDFAVRLGETVTHGWRLGRAAMRQLRNQPRPLDPSDLVPNISQKGVDLRIGLDIARLALRQLVQIVVVVTGDSDLIPAFKFARREGLRVYLGHLNHGVRRDLKAHTDALLEPLEIV
jgi:uncharacterized LabA/DUF88 family protein